MQRQVYLSPYLYKRKTVSKSFRDPCLGYSHKHHNFFVKASKMDERKKGVLVYGPTLLTCIYLIPLIQ